MTRLMVGLLLLAACNTGNSGAGGPSGPGPGPGTDRTFPDLAYASVSSTQRLDLYLPPVGDGPFPLVIWVHGGGWETGDKELTAAPFPLGLLDHGFALASVNYRLSGEATFPAPIHDVKAAVRWLRANAAQYRLDPNRFGAWGSSAGGHLVALLGTSTGAAALEGSELGNAGVSSRVQAVVDWFGPTDLSRLAEDAEAVGCSSLAIRIHTSPQSPEARMMGAPIDDRPDLAAVANPVTYVSADDPPYLIQHGAIDCIVPLPQSDDLEGALETALGAGGVSFIVLPATGHSGPAFYTDANLERVFAFFDQVLK